MTPADFLPIAAELAPDKASDVAMALWLAWSNGHRDGRNEMLWDERVVVKYDKTEASQ